VVRRSLLPPIFPTLRGLFLRPALPSLNYLSILLDGRFRFLQKPSWLEGPNLNMSFSCSCLVALELPHAPTVSRFLFPLPNSLRPLATSRISGFAEYLD